MGKSPLLDTLVAYTYIATIYYSLKHYATKVIIKLIKIKLLLSIMPIGTTRT